ncbi:MAG: ribonuclease H-like domain-containing protein [Lachnospiraceae bacterium]|nr:ribonuclease H-like domain-containing protein [Lachnospiraceae bacterium]
MKAVDEIITDIRIPEALSLLSRETAARRPLFFDIETTGLNALACYIYLIGCLIETPDGLRFRQWFAENADEEPEIIRCFLETVENDTVLVHYNGNTFDIPFLKERVRHHRMPLSVPNKEETLDLYRHLSRSQKLLGLPNRKQPSLEKAVGYNRTDPYDGCTLIAFYSEYVGRCRFDKARAEELLASLLLHNRDDILGLSQIPALLPYCIFSDLPLTDARQSVTDGTVTYTATLPCALPKPFRKILPLPEIPASCRIQPMANTTETSVPQTPDGVTAPSDDVSENLFADLLLSGQTVRLQVPVYKMAPYYFFEDYKNYYYLPVEDKAIHKSLASFVAKEYRKPATRETARQQKSGSFLPQITEQIGPVFRFRHNDELCFFERTDLDAADIRDYILNWFRFLTEQ